ncbi:immediate early response gene 5 protein [Osmerus mordax]|uniref:immediate early response gene 5 protein n=1 Tax=Osmerus mordax TaxID=8014 RepID=UPI003510729A
MEYKIEAHRIMSMSLGKIYNSRIQRGGIKLHKNLLVSLVLRSARHIYLSQYYSGMCLSTQQVVSQQEEREWREGEYMDLNQDKCISIAPDHLTGAPAEDAPVQLKDNGPSAVANEESDDVDIDTIPQTNCTTKLESPDLHYASEGSETPPEASENTDITTDYVTVISSKCNSDKESPIDGQISRTFLGDKSDILQAHRSCANRKRTSENLELQPTKRTKISAQSAYFDADSNEVCEEMDTGNVTSLITIFGSSFSGLLSKDTAQSGSEAADSGLGQVCDQMLKIPNPWTTAIVAF